MTFQNKKEDSTGGGGEGKRPRHFKKA